MAFWVSCSCTLAAAARASSIILVACWPAWTMTSWRFGLGLGQLLLDLLGIVQALLDALLALLEHCQDGLVGIAVQQERHDGEADALRDEVRPVHAEGPGDVLRRLRQVAADAAEENGRLHKS